MGKLRRNAFGCGFALAVMAFCGEISSGRGISAFYAQTGVWSWAGAGVSCIIYGLLTAGIIRLRRRTGANSLAGVYTGIFGRRGGIAFSALHTAFYALSAYALLGAAADAAGISLPFRNADIMGFVSALTISVWISLRGNHGIRKTGCACFAMLAAVMFALVFSGKIRGGNTLHFYVELRLENAPWAAVLLAAAHASMAAAMCAAAAVRLFPAHIKPGAAGFASAAAFGMLLLIGNGVFAVHPKEINALRYPFIALSASWGAAGFYIFALLRWLESTVCLCGIFCMLPAKKC